MILIIILALVVSCIVYGITGSWIAFIILGIILALMVVAAIFTFLVEEHPVTLECICLIASLTCAIISASTQNIWALVICMCSIGALKGMWVMSDADTSWYDTDTISIDGIMYRVFDKDRSDFIALVGFVFFVAVYYLLAAPYAMLGIEFLAFIPSIFFLIRWFIGLKRSA